MWHASRAASSPAELMDSADGGLTICVPADRAPVTHAPKSREGGNELKRGSTVTELTPSG